MEFLRGLTTIKDEQSLKRAMEQKSDRVKVFLRFMVSATKIVRDNDRLEVSLQRNELHGGNFNHFIRPNPRAAPLKDLSCQMLIRCVGYQSRK